MNHAIRFQQKPATWQQAKSAFVRQFNCAEMSIDVSSPAHNDKIEHI